MRKGVENSMEEKEKAGEKLSYEEAVAQLEQLVKQMESGNLTLQESVSAYEKGIGLIRFCESELEKYEKLIGGQNADVKAGESGEEGGGDF